MISHNKLRIRLHVLRSRKTLSPPFTSLSADAPSGVRATRQAASLGQPSAADGQEPHGFLEALQQVSVLETQTIRRQPWGLWAEPPEGKRKKADREEQTVVSLKSGSCWKPGLEMPATFSSSHQHALLLHVRSRLMIPYWISTAGSLLLNLPATALLTRAWTKCIWHRCVLHKAHQSSGAQEHGTAFGHHAGVMVGAGVGGCCKRHKTTETVALQIPWKGTCSQLRATPWRQSVTLALLHLNWAVCVLGGSDARPSAHVREWPQKLRECWFWGYENILTSR